MNTVTLSGNLTNDVELYKGENFVVANLRLANNGWDGSKQILNGYFDVSVFNPSKAVLGLLKGERVIVTGRLNQTTFERTDGTKGSRTKIVANAIARSLEFDAKEVEAEANDASAAS